MKKMRRLIPFMTVCLLLFPMLHVQAAPWQKNQQAPKAVISNLEGIVVMSLEQINSLEGTFKIVEKPKDGSASIQSVNATCSDMGAQGMSKNDKIFLSSSGDSMNVKLEISMKFTKAGVYTLELDGGVTNAAGIYEDYSGDPKSCICQVEIQAGDVSVGNPSVGDSATEGTLGGDFNYNSEFNLNINVETEELEEALEEVADAIKSDEQLAMMQQLLDKMNQGIALLEGGDQESVDKATEELQESLEKLETEPKEETETEIESAEEPTEVVEVEVISDEEPAKKGGNRLLMILCIFTLLLAAGAAAFYFWRKKRNKAPDYDGAPMVDYDIEEDDE